MPVRIIDCTSSTGLHRRYDGQSQPQPAYIELDLQAGTLLADYDSEIGNGQPPAVRNGFERRYRIPLLTGDAANRVMREIAPLADRILADWKDEWDGSNMIAIIGEDAAAAENQIEERLGCNLGYGDLEAGTQGFSDGDLIAVWDDGYSNGCEVDDFNITADTTDERLEEIEQEIVASLAEVGPSDAVVCVGLDQYLKHLRADLVNA